MVCWWSAVSQLCQAWTDGQFTKHFVHSQLFQPMPLASGQPSHPCGTVRFSISEVLTLACVSQRTQSEETKAKNITKLHAPQTVGRGALIVPRILLSVPAYLSFLCTSSYPSSPYKNSHLISPKIHQLKLFNKHGWFYPKHLNQFITSQVGVWCLQQEECLQIAVT